MGVSRHPTAPTAIETRDAIARGESTAEQATSRVLALIAEHDSVLHAFLALDPDRALTRARELDRNAGNRGTLHGVPIAIKDNLCVQGFPATAGSRILRGWMPPYDATVVTRLEQAGAVILGKTNCDEFAMGSSTEHSAYGPSRNPHDTERIPGGSSGGSAVAVAAGFAPLALGSDTGGSVRQPAALCGIVGMRPTYGRVSRYGLIAFASSLDQVGPFARTVADTALLQDVMEGPDPHDATCASGPFPSCSSRLTAGVAGLRVGVPKRLLEEGVDPEMLAAFDRSIETYADLGADIVPIDLPHSQHSIPVYYLVATAEASSNLARYDGIRYGPRASAATLGQMYERTRSQGFGQEVKRRLMLGTYALSAGYYDAFYLKAQQVRELIRRDFTVAFEACDVVAMPTSPTPAFRLGERLDDPLQMYLADVFTVGSSLAGLPAISLPCGLTAGGLPLGLQIIGRRWDDATVYRVAAGLEAALAAS
jgi:aspartyl-tRNA(Asn)/glutamyl-tRNA(Gln) amidotransferase subunit A